MRTERRYQLVTSGVAVCSVALAILVANHPLSQRLFTSLPLGSRLTPTVLSGDPLWRAVATTVAVMVVALVPLFRRPRRVLDVIIRTERQVVIGCLALAAVGYLDYTFRLPRTTFVLTSLLLCVLPLVFVAIDRRFLAAADQTIIVGDDWDQIERILAETDRPIAGYVSSPRRRAADTEHPRTTVPLTDGGLAATTSARDTRSGTSEFSQRSTELFHLGSLSQLSAVLRTYDVDRAILAFSTPNRTEFFRTLATCYTHGVSVTAHRACADAVLTRGEREEFVDIDLEPWSATDYALKYLFDKTFAIVGLLVLAPSMILIALAIKLEDGGPIFYSQERTTIFGRTFRLYKFRTMTPGSEDTVPTTDEENAHITRVGRLLRRTHVDELPQLYSILVGDMSVVGPRAAWIEEEERFLTARNDQWRKRWFVKPGLTGLAQVNDVSSTNPDLKLRYDIEYIRRQSFSLDVKLVATQLWIVLVDLLSSSRLTRGLLDWIGTLTSVPATDERD